MVILGGTLSLSLVLTALASEVHYPAAAASAPGMVQ